MNCEVNDVKDLIKKIVRLFFAKCKIKNVIVLESHADYSANTKTLFEYMIKKYINDKYKFIWFVDDASKFNHIKIKNVKFISMWGKNNKRNLIQHLRYILILKNTKFILFSNRSIPKVNPKTISIYLNHGTPLKKVKNIKLISDDVDYALCASPFCIDITEDQLHLKKKQLICIGNPRDDTLFLTDRKIKQSKLGYKNNEKIIIWLPTFRQNVTTKRKDSNFIFPLGIPIIYNESQLNQLNKLLKEKNIVILLKPHPVQDLSIINSKKLSNIQVINDNDLMKKDIELLELFAITDGLITDYSSVYFEYLLTNKPIAFTLDDYKEYSLSKGFVFDNPLKYMAGDKIYKFNDMKKFINNIASNIDNYYEERQKMNNLFNQYQDSNSCQRFIDYFNISK